MMNLGKKWKSWKNRVKERFFDPNLPLEENLSRRPNTEDVRVFPDQWKNLVIHWNSQQARNESSRNKENRAKRKMMYVTGKKSFAQIEEELKNEAKGIAFEREGVELDGDSTDDEPTRLDIFERCFTRNGNTTDPIVAEKLGKMKEKRSELPPGAKDKGPNDIYSNVIGPDKGGRIRMYGFGVTASDVYGEIFSKKFSTRKNMASQAEIDMLKQRTDEQARIMQEQDKQIQEQNRQIQELLKLNKHMMGSMDVSPNVAQFPSLSSYHPIASRRHSVANIDKMPLRVGTNVLLKSMAEPSKIIAMGRLESLNPSILVEGVELGKNWCKVHINVVVDMREELPRPIPECTTLGEVIGRTIAWPRSMVEMEED